MQHKSVSCRLPSTMTSWPRELVCCHYLLWFQLCQTSPCLQFIFLSQIQHVLRCGTEPKQYLTITIFYIIKTILIYFYSLGFSLNARPQKPQLFNHYRVEIKVVVLYCMVLYCKTSKRGREILLLLVNEHFFFYCCCFF